VTPRVETLPIFRCDCGFGTVMARPYCPKCRGTLHPARAPAEGRILPWTILATTPEGFASPLGLAVVGLTAGMNAVARFDPEKPPAIRQNVRLAIRDGLRWIREA